MNNFYSVLNFELPDGTAHIPNSPRTLEACLRSGFDPRELVPTPLEAYFMPGEPKAVSTVKHGHFEKKRQEKVKVVTQERVAICNYLSTLKHGGFEDNAMLSSTSKNKASKYVTSDTKVLTVTVKFDPSKSLKSTGPPEAAKSSVNLKSSMLELEMKRFEAMKRRQEKEIRRIVASESKLADLQKKLVKAEHDDIERKKEHHKRVAKARADTVEKKRVREMERKKRDEEELARRRDLAKKDAELEIKKARHERKMEKVRARDAMEREMERRRLLEAQAAKTKAIMDHQIQLAEDSRKKMNAKSERVKQAMERKMELKRLEVEEQRKKAERKIHTVVERNKKIQLDKRAAFNQKQAEIARFKAEKAVEIKKKVEMDSKKREDKHLRQKQKKDEAMGKVEDRKSKILKQLADREHYKYVVEAERAEKMAVKSLREELHKEDKRQNVERLRRMNEYMRLQTANKLEEDDARTEKIKEQKEKILAERRKMAHENFLRKAAVKEAMEQMKVTNKFVDIEELLAGGKKGRKGRRNLDDSYDSDADY